ncbi:MAG: DNA polymerase III subunit delta [Planctomycetaceae bacterium]
MHATAFLKAPPSSLSGAIVVLSGTERSLKLDALAVLTPIVCGDSSGDSAATKFKGEETDWKSVRDELLTVSMFGDRRLVLVEDAEDFVSDNRATLEKYLEKPAKKSLLILDVGSFPKTTKLYKAVDKLGLLIECTELTGADLTRWIQATVKDRFGKQITRDAAMLLPELAGTHLGSLEQEIEKLAAYASERSQIDTEDIRKVVGGWKAETIWVMLNAVRDGQLGFALSNLDKLLTAGEPALKLLGGIAFVFRKLALATELSRDGLPLSVALKQAGIFQPRDQSAGEAYLRRLGRARAEQISHWLLETDLNLKGGLRSSDRLLLEQLFLNLSGKLHE